MPIFGTLHVVACLQEARGPTYNLGSDLSVCGSFHAQRDAEDSDRVLAKCHWHSVNERFSPGLTTKPLSERVDLRAIKHASFRPVSKSRYCLEILLCALSIGGSRHE